jgi:L-rhamnose mutarotase
MKRLPFCLLMLILLFAGSLRATDIYVSTRGNDNQDGTINKPLQTLQAAIRKARELRRLQAAGIEKGITIKLEQGIYPVYETIPIYPEDAGTVQSPLQITSAGPEMAVLSGGVNITGWKKLATAVKGLPAAVHKQVWVADVPVLSGTPFLFRQLWVNHHKATRAKYFNGNTMGRILGWNKTDASCQVLLPKPMQLKSTSPSELFIHQWWAIAMLRIKQVKYNKDTAAIYFYEPESKIQNEHPWPAPWISKHTGNSAFNLTNAMEFLDEPGEWYLDADTRKIYYWPLPGEQMNKADVVAPFTETLINIHGTAGKPVKYVYFKNIEFANTGWQRPSQYGHVPHQAGMYMTEAYKLRPAGTTERPQLDNQAWIGRPAAAVQVAYAAHTGFENCVFTQMASTALDYHKGVYNNNIRGNVFRNIGGTAIAAGVFSEPSQEIHTTYFPKDTSLYCDRLSVVNNLVTDVANEDWSCAAITLGYTRNSLVANNHIENTSYSGISMGWGWNPNENMMRNNTVKANRILLYGKHNYDCAGVYTLSAQPGSVIEDNYIDSVYKAPYAHLRSHWFYLYTDEGSSHITIRNNYTPSSKYLQNNNGPGSQWENNGPQVSPVIKQKAGLQDKNLLQYAKGYDKAYAINEEHPEIIEIIVHPDSVLNVQKLKTVLHQYQLDSSAVYQWKNRFVVFANMQDVGVMEGRLQKNFPGTTVKAYYDLFYQYDKKKHCPDKELAKEWDHFIITANLVADTKKQQAYLDYHATQFEQWPEVAKGFCQAGFQQLLLFKNERQLMLIISVPKGKTLAELDPKTTENNPKVKEWNKIMSQYQEGVKGTEKGEVWVELRKL